MHSIIKRRNGERQEYKNPGLVRKKLLDIVPETLEREKREIKTVNAFHTNIRRDVINSSCSLDISDGNERQYPQDGNSCKVFLMLQEGHMARFEDAKGGHISSALYHAWGCSLSGIEKLYYSRMLIPGSQRERCFAAVVWPIGANVFPSQEKLNHSIMPIPGC